MRLTKYEKETIILMNAGDKEATVYTADRTVMRRLDALVKKYPESYRIVSYQRTTCQRPMSCRKYTSAIVNRATCPKHNGNRRGIK